MTDHRDLPPAADAAAPEAASAPVGYEDKMLRPARHGWVTPLPDGARARCGGPGLCPTCRRELLGRRAFRRRLAAAATIVPPEARS